MLAPASITVENVSRCFGETLAIDRVSFEVKVGGCCALIGPSGCGKTTLLRMIGGLDAPDSGSMTRCDGESAFVFQEPRLLPWLTLLDNVALPLRLRGMTRAESRERAAEAISLVKLSDAHARTPAQLSGGMRMRASLARALIAKPKVLLLDEPMSGLDDVTRHELDEELRELWERERFTVILVTHSVAEAAYLAEEIIVLTPRPARIVARVATPSGERDASSWTSPQLNTSVRIASEAMLRAITQDTRKMLRT